MNWLLPARLAVLLLVWLCWLLAAPFLPAICWAFALALIGHPVYAWLCRKRVPENLAALSMLLLTAFLVIGPCIILVRALATEAAGVVNRASGPDAAQNLQTAISDNYVTGPILRWLDVRFDLAPEAMQLARSLAGWASGRFSMLLSGSIWLVTQVSIALFVLFYFLRDGALIFTTARAAVKSFVPLSDEQMEAVSLRVAQTVRVSLGAKLLMGAIQGTLGGLIFAWLGLPAPVFWGAVMVCFSVFPIFGAFVVWVPAALLFALQSDWRHALMLTAWGVLVINPVDNLLGPVLVGTTLRMHTLVMFFSVLGGLAAFGAAGLVLGPVTAAVAVALHETGYTGSKMTGQEEK